MKFQMTIIVIFICTTKSIKNLVYFYYLIFKTTYIKLYIILLKYVYKSKRRIKLHQNNKINQNFKLYNKNIIVESEK